MRNAVALGINTDHRQLTTGDLGDLIRLEAMSFHSHADFNRRIPRSDRAGIETDPVPDVHRFLEFNTSEGDRHPSMPAMVSRLIESSLVDQGEDHSTENRSQRIRVLGHHLDSEGEIL
mgnify:CR=1 FL=1